MHELDNSMQAQLHDLGYVHAVIAMNLRLLHITEAMQPGRVSVPAIDTTEAPEVLRRIEALRDKSGANAKRQFHLLIWGGLFYAGWHVWELIMGSHLC